MEDEIETGEKFPVQKKFPSPFKLEEATPVLEYPTIAIPNSISHFIIDGILATGKMSIVYIAHETQTHKPCVIKVLQSKFISDQQIIDDFLNEAKTLSLTHHPHIAELYEWGKWEQGYFIALEYIAGKSLHTVLTHQPLSLRKALEVLIQISYAVCHLHSLGIVHGDLKPENIIISEDNIIKLIDLGIAHTLNKQSGGKNYLKGTPVYMSPEHIQGTPTFQSDIYSLGIIAYELVLGKITHGKITLSFAPKGLQPILAKALQKKPEDRFTDIVDFISAVSSYIQSGEFQKDRSSSNYFFELHENIDFALKKLLPQECMLTSFGTIATAHSINLNSTIAFFKRYDFSNGDIGYLIGYTGTKNVLGVIQAECITSSIDLLLSLDPSSFSVVYSLQEFQKKPEYSNFAYSFFIFSPEKNQYKYISSQLGLLLEYQNDQSIIFPKSHNDFIVNELVRPLDNCTRLCLFIHPSNIEEEKMKSEFSAIFLESATLSVETQVDVLLRKYLLLNSSVEDTPTFVFCLDFKSNKL